MKKISYFLLALLPFIGCKKEEAPTFSINLTTTASSKWEAVTIDVSSFSFYSEADAPGSIGTSNLQQWEGIIFEHELNTSATTNLTNYAHWEMTTIGVKPYMFINLRTLDGADKRVTIDYYNFFPLSNNFIIENNKVYEINMTINTDAVFVETDDTISFDWTNVDVEIFEI